MEEREENGFKTHFFLLRQKNGFHIPKKKAAERGRKGRPAGVFSLSPSQAHPLWREGAAEGSRKPPRARAVP